MDKRIKHTGKKTTKMNDNNKMLKYIYEMKKDVAVIKEHMTHLNGSVEDTIKGVAENRNNIQESNLKLSRRGGIAFGVLVALQFLQGGILLFNYLR